MKEEDENEHGQIKAGAVIVYVGIVLANFEWFFDLIWTISSDFNVYKVEQVEETEEVSWEEQGEEIETVMIAFPEISLKQAANTFCMFFLVWNVFMYSVYILSNADINSCGERT
jgi:hypothetical protein